MATHIRKAEGTMILAELQEFASFTPAEQRYIRRSLDVAFCRSDAVALWSRDKVEEASIKLQQRVYVVLDDLRGFLPDNGELASLPEFMGGLIGIAAFDLAQGRITCFGAFRFLYERLLGANVRAWLPAAYCGAASLPHLEPEQRRELLQAISEAAATAPGWSNRQPHFFPEWVEKEEDLIG